MRRLNIKWVVGLMAVIASACAAGDTVGSNGETLIDAREWVGQTLYFDANVGEPLTAEAMGDTTNAVPVQLEFYDSFAIAWRVQGDRPLIGQREAIVAAWSFRGVAIANETRALLDSRITAGPGRNRNRDTHGIGAGLGVDARDSLNRERTTSFSQDRAIAIRWRELQAIQNIALIRELGSYHPGCL